MTAISEDDIWAALAELDVPNTDKNILEKNMVNNLILKDRNVSFVIEINPSEKEIMEPLRRAAEVKILDLPGVSTATVALTAHKTAPNSESKVNFWSVELASAKLLEILPNDDSSTNDSPRAYLHISQ
ncbi:MAG: hypothetical protein CMM82_06155, partial [Rhodospirillales bacterium]|nr:hypothetical protein [Rhodospirillales bacterium]